MSLVLQINRALLEAQVNALLDAAHMAISALDELDGDPDLELTCEDEGAQCDDEGDIAYECGGSYANDGHDQLRVVTDYGHPFAHSRAVVS